MHDEGRQGKQACNACALASAHMAFLFAVELVVEAVKSPPSEPYFANPDATLDIPTDGPGFSILQDTRLRASNPIQSCAVLAACDTSGE